MSDIDILSGDDIACDEIDQKESQSDNFENFINDEIEIIVHDETA